MREELPSPKVVEGDDDLGRLIRKADAEMTVQDRAQLEAAMGHRVDDPGSHVERSSMTEEGGQRTLDQKIAAAKKLRGALVGERTVHMPAPGVAVVQESGLGDREVELPAAFSEGIAPIALTGGRMRHEEPQDLAPDYGRADEQKAEMMRNKRQPVKRKVKKPKEVSALEKEVVGSVQQLSGGEIARSFRDPKTGEMVRREILNKEGSLVRIEKPKKTVQEPAPVAAPVAPAAAPVSAPPSPVVPPSTPPQMVQPPQIMPKPYEKRNWISRLFGAAPNPMVGAPMHGVYEAAPVAPPQSSRVESVAPQTLENQTLTDSTALHMEEKAEAAFPAASEGERVAALQRMWQRGEIRGYAEALKQLGLTEPEQYREWFETWLKKKGELTHDEQEQYIYAANKLWRKERSQWRWMRPQTMGNVDPRTKMGEILAALVADANASRT